MRLLERAALDGHSAVPLETVLAAVARPVVEGAVDRGAVLVADGWVALDEIALVEDALADEILGLAAEDRLALVLGSVPEGAEVVEVGDAHRRSLEDLAEALQAVPEDVRVVISGDPDALPGPHPGAVLADLLAWGRLPVRDLRPDGAAGGTALAALPASLRAGSLPAPADRSVVVVPCADDEAVVRRAVQLVTDSVPRVFGVAAQDVLVVTPLRRGAAGVRALVEALPAGTRVSTVHDAARGGPLPAADAVVACFPGQATGVLSRALVYSAAMLAGRHLSVVTAAGDALPQAVVQGAGRPRWTRLPGLLASSE
ncbi:MAG: hypothetical protein ACHQE5_01590 [Actinomycetes bacterium]